MEIKRTPANSATWALYIDQLKEFIRAVKARDYWRVMHAKKDVRITRAHLRQLS